MSHRALCVFSISIWDVVGWFSQNLVWTLRHWRPPYSSAS